MFSAICIIGGTSLILFTIPGIICYLTQNMWWIYLAFLFFPFVFMYLDWVIWKLGDWF